MNKLDINILNVKIDVVRKRLKRLEEYRLLTVQDYLDSDDIQDIVERNLEVLIRAAVDINKFLLKRVSTLSREELTKIKNAESFILLARNNLLAEVLANKLAKSGGFRNVLAHLYDELIPEEVINALQNTLEFYPDYLYSIQMYLDSLED